MSRRREIQVWDGSDDASAMCYRLTTELALRVEQLHSDLDTNARWWPTGPTTIRMRLFNIPALVKWLKTGNDWPAASTAVRDLQEINSLHVAVGNRASTIARIESILHDLQDIQQLRGAA